MSEWASPSSGPLARDEVRTYGRRVGSFTGLLGYFGGAIGAWAVNFAAGRASDPRAGYIVLGALAGIAVVMLFAMWLFWKPYRDRPFRVEDTARAAGSAGIGVGQSFGAAVTALLVVVYAGTVILMWVLACAFLIFAVAA
jgi:hypothetical protein